MRMRRAVGLATVIFLAVAIALVVLELGVSLRWRPLVRKRAYGKENDGNDGSHRGGDQTSGASKSSRSGEQEEDEGEEGGEEAIGVHRAYAVSFLTTMLLLLLWMIIIDDSYYCWKSSTYVCVCVVIGRRKLFVLCHL